MAGTVTEISIGGALDLRAAGQKGGPELLQVGPPLREGRRTVL